MFLKRISSTPLTAAVLVLASSAGAVTVANRDDNDHSVTIIEGNTQESHVLKPNGVLEGVCNKGCLIRLDGSDEDPYELEGSEVTSIEGGLLYDDGSDVPAGAEYGAGGQPSEPDTSP